MPEFKKAYDEIVDFFAKNTNTERLLAFRTSEENQLRVQELMLLSQEDELTPDERYEFQQLCAIEQFVQLVKSRVDL